MSYKSLITKNVAKAFILLKDLAVNAILSKKATQSFDFSTGTFPPAGLMSDEVSQSLYDEAALAIQGELAGTLSLVKIIFISEAKLSEETNLVVCKALLRASGIVDLNTYDSLIVGNTIWQLGPVISTNGFVYEIKLQRVP